MTKERERRKKNLDWLIWSAFFLTYFIGGAWAIGAVLLVIFIYFNLKRKEKDANIRRL